MTQSSANGDFIHYIQYRIQVVILAVASFQFLFHFWSNWDKSLTDLMIPGQL